MTNNTADDMKREAALKALDYIEAGQIVGLGTGSTAVHFVKGLGARVRAGLQITGVATSKSTAELAAAEGIALKELDDVTHIDVTVDGADEAARDFTLIKGGGAAHVREKIVAAASRKMIAIMDGSKLVDALGRFPLPVEILPFAYHTTMRHLAAAAAELGCRNNHVHLRGREGHPVVSDNGNYIADLDCGFIPDAAALGQRLSAIPGVVDHGLFVGLCKMLIVGHAGGVTILE